MRYFNGFIFALASCAALVSLVILMRPTSDPLPPEVQAEILQTSQAAAAAAQAQQAAAAEKARKPASRKKANSWKLFQDRFGDELVPEFSQDGYLVSIRGRLGQGKRARGEFSPQDPQRAIGRAKDIVEAARDLLGIQEEAPLGHPTAKASATSAQVFFQETFQGVSIAPYGAITVDLGPQGELVGLDSTYVRDIQVGNESKLDSEQARDKAANAFKSISQNSKPEGGHSVIWLSSPTTASGNVAHRAYEYFIQGQQVVVDASNGTILFSRDRRHF